MINIDKLDYLCNYINQLDIEGNDALYLLCYFSINDKLSLEEEILDQYKILQIKKECESVSLHVIEKYLICLSYILTELKTSNQKLENILKKGEVKV